MDSVREHGIFYGYIHNKKEDSCQPMSSREKALNAGCMINNFILANFKTENRKGLG